MNDDLQALTAGQQRRLAIDGGDPVRTEPMSPWPVYADDEIEAAVAVLRSGRVNYWTGDECKAFEAEFAKYHGRSHAISLANGSLALDLALRVLNIGPDDEVIVTPRSYVASASCIALAGARAVFAEVDRDSQNITADAIEPLISPKTRAVLVVHLAGWPCDMLPIVELAREHGLHVIEDCAQALGSRINDRPVGSFGDLAAFSFCQDKIMSTGGEGGMLITDNKNYWQAAWSFKDHGKSWDRVHENMGTLGFRLLHESLGSNYRMTEPQAAIGRLQLAKLDGWVRRRRQNAAALKQGLSGVAALRIPWPAHSAYHAFYKFYAFVRPDRLNDEWCRDRILEALDREGVPGWSGSCPEIYREVAFGNGQHPTLTNAHELGETSIMLPVHPTLTDLEIEDLIAALQKIFSVAQRM